MKEADFPEGIHRARKQRIRVRISTGSRGRKVQLGGRILGLPEVQQEMVAAAHPDFIRTPGRSANSCQCEQRSPIYLYAFLTRTEKNRVQGFPEK